MENRITEISLDTTLYQVKTLIQSLEEINEVEYPQQAYQIKEVFTIIAECMERKLLELGNRKILSDANLVLIRKHGEIAREIFSKIRFLEASDPYKTPPAIQFALTELSKRFFPAEGKPIITLVRPQWHYNLNYKSITKELRDFIQPSELDPENNYGAKTLDELIAKLWEEKWNDSSNKDESKKIELPKCMATLSFPRLEKTTLLLYPLLCHEMAHSIDYAGDEPWSSSEKAKRNSHVTLRTLEDKYTFLDTQGDGQQTENDLTELLNRIDICRREILADLIAARMMGFCFFAAQADFLKTVSDWPESQVLIQGYPGFAYRLKLILTEILKNEDGYSLEEFLRNSADKGSEKIILISKKILGYLDEWKKTISAAYPENKNEKTSENGEREAPESSSEICDMLAKEAIGNVIDTLDEIATRLINPSQFARLSDSFFERIELLQNDLPPYLPGDNIINSLAEIFSASWAYSLLSENDDKEGTLEYKERFRRTEIMCRLILKAVELAAFWKSDDSNSVDSSPNNNSTSRLQNVCSGPGIIRLIKSKKLHIIPFSEKNVKGGSVDVHLGNWFKVARRTRIPNIDLGKHSKIKKISSSTGFEQVYIPPDKNFVMHPGDFVLGATAEFVALPPDVMAFVEGKSSLGRSGLFIATATQIGPGFHGVVILELVNSGVVPLILVPYMAIGQIVFLSLDSPVPDTYLYRGDFHCQIFP